MISNGIHFGTERDVENILRIFGRSISSLGLCSGDEGIKPVFRQWLGEAEPFEPSTTDAAPDLDVRLELAVQRAGTHGDYPRGDVRDRSCIWPRVACRTDDDDPILHCVEGPYGDPVVEVVSGIPSDGD